MIFEQSGKVYKAIVFTRHPPDDKNAYLLMNHNVDPSSDEPCYGMRYRGPRPASDFQTRKKDYRIHLDDKEKVRMLKIPYKKEK